MIMTLHEEPEPFGFEQEASEAVQRYQLHVCLVVLNNRIGCNVHLICFVFVSVHGLAHFWLCHPAIKGSAGCG
jgi:hypothetical protein